MTELFDQRSWFDKDYVDEDLARLGTNGGIDDWKLIERLGKVEPGDRVLDAGCGYGRILQHVNPTSPAFGIDINPDLIQLASIRCQTAHLAVADFRQLPFMESSFHVVLSWFGSFGYHDDLTNLAVLQEFRRVLKPKGRLVLEHANRDIHVQTLPTEDRPMWQVRQRANGLVVDQLTFSALDCHLTIRRFMPTVATPKTYRLRLFTFPELRSLLLEAGFSKIDPTGSEGEAFNLRSKRMVIVAGA